MLNKIWIAFCFTLSIIGSVNADNQPKKIGVGISFSNTDYLAYPAEILNLINYKATLQPTSRMRLEPFIGLRDYNIRVGHLTLAEDNTQRDNHWDIQAFGLGVSYLFPMNSFDIGLGCLFRKDIVNYEEIVSISVQGEVESGVGIYNKYDIDSYFVKIELAKIIGKIFRLGFEGGYRLSNQLHDSRLLGEIQDHTNGIHYGISMELMLF